MTHLRLLGAGRSADVFAIDETWVLRRTRDGTDTGAESAIMTFVAQSGFPVPRQKVRVPGARPEDLVLERLRGPTMADAVLAGALDPATAGGLLAELLDRLHAIPVPDAADRDDRVVHLDLHPENVILTARGPVVIDWTNATVGRPGVDRAMCALILAQVSLTMPSAPGAAVRATLAALCEELSASGGISGEDLSIAVDRRVSDPGQTSAERDLIHAARALVASEAGRDAAR
ncbi:MULTISPECIES: phosphotransferase [Microbacterium]|uniref:phosphotransferase n=1 Tax=Microbacterium TaxID=33882 RepID=UPI000D64786A|nr:MULTISPECIES: phosphotransferase [Microbacterium]